MWLSSFASAATSAPLTVNALVWSAETAVTDAKAPLASEDALVLATTADIRVLRHLRVVNGSYVRLSREGDGARAHVAKLLLAGSQPPSSNSSGGDADAVTTALTPVIGDITLSPLLAFNLGIPLHSANDTRVAVQVRVTATLGGARTVQR